MHGFRELIQLHLTEQAERDVARRQDELRARVDKLRADIEEARGRQGAAEEHVKALHLERKKVELDVQQHEGTRRKYRDQLMSAKTNEIYKTLLHEIEHEAGQISALETRVLEMMEEADAAGAQVEAARKDVAAAQAVLLAEEKRLLADVESLQEERAACQARVAELTPLVDASALAQYRRVAEQRGGRGMAQVKDMQCTECRVGVRPQAWVDLLQLQRPLTCAGCKRILFREENMRPEAGAPAAAS